MNAQLLVYMWIIICSNAVFCLHTVTMKYDTLILLLGFLGRKPATDYGSKQESAEDCNKQNWQWERPSLSLPHSLSLQGEIDMGAPTLYKTCTCQRTGRPFDQDWYRGRARQKESTRGEFSNYGSKLVAFHSSLGEDA